MSHDRHFISPSNSALPTVLFLAARITDYSPSYPSNLDQGYLFTELKLYLSSTRAWPISQDSGLGNVLTRVMGEFVPRTPGSPAVCLLAWHRCTEFLARWFLGWNFVLLHSARVKDAIPFGILMQ